MKACLTLTVSMIFLAYAYHLGVKVSFAARYVSQCLAVGLLYILTWGSECDYWTFSPSVGSQAKGIISKIKQNQNALLFIRITPLQCFETLSKRLLSYNAV